MSDWRHDFTADMSRKIYKNTAAEKFGKMRVQRAEIFPCQQRNTRVQS